MDIQKLQVLLPDTWKSTGAQCLAQSGCSFSVHLILDTFASLTTYKSDDVVMTGLLSITGPSYLSMVYPEPPHGEN